MRPMRTQTTNGLAPTGATVQRCTFARDRDPRAARFSRKRKLSGNHKEDRAHISTGSADRSARSIGARERDPALQPEGRRSVSAETRRMEDRGGPTDRARGREFTEVPGWAGGLLTRTDRLNHFFSGPVRSGCGTRGQRRRSVIRSTRAVGARTRRLLGCARSGDLVCSDGVRDGCGRCPPVGASGPGAGRQDGDVIPTLGRGPAG
jgi:hypothetical protein